MKTRIAVLVLAFLSACLFAASQETSANGKVTTLDEGSNHALSGTGTKNFIPLWRSATKLGNSIIFQSTAGNVGISTSKPAAKLDVNGAINAATSFDLAGVPFAFGSFSNQNVFLGFAGNSTTTGGQNTAVGQGALSFNTLGPLNAAIGNSALFANTTGGDNVACGAIALANNTTGDNNTASGLAALQNNLTGSDNTALGFVAGPDPGSPNLFNATAIGSHARVNESNALVLGGTDTFAVKVGIGTATPANVFTIARGAGEAISDGWETYSSRQWKTNIHTLHGALGKVEQLRGVSYDLKANGKHEVGVIAEEVGTVVPEVVTWDKNGQDAQGVDYSRLTALLIEATKEQQLLIHKQQVQLARLTSQVRAMQTSFKRSSRSASEVRTVKTQGKPKPPSS